MYNISFYLESILSVLLVTIGLLLSIASVTLLERKTMGLAQRRIGPNKVGPYGILQPIVDAIKSLIKEIIIPQESNKILFVIGPFIALIFSLLGWAIIPIYKNHSILDMDLSILYTLAISSIGIYGILISGWSANSKYAYYGSIRSTAQMISYELILTTVVLVIVMITSSLNYSVIIEIQKITYLIFPLAPVSIIFLIGCLAETNRAPLDLVEAESELVSGHFTEHSGSIFVFFFLAEYGSLLLMSALISILFLGGDSFLWGSLALKTCLILFLFVFIRASLPRFLFTHVVNLGWNVLLPLVFGIILFIPCLLNILAV